MENSTLPDLGVDSVTLIHLSSLLSSLSSSHSLSLSHLLSHPVKDIVEYLDGSRDSLLSPIVRWDEDMTLPDEIVTNIQKQMGVMKSEEQWIEEGESTRVFLTGANGFVGIHILHTVRASLFLSLTHACTHTHTQSYSSRCFGQSLCQSRSSSPFFLTPSHPDPHFTPSRICHLPSSQRDVPRRVTRSIIRIISTLLPSHWR